MKNLFLNLALLSFLASSHPSMKQVSADEYKQRFASAEAALSFACKNEEGFTALEFKFDDTEEKLNCNCPEGSVLTIAIKNEANLVKEYLESVNLEAVSKFMELQNLEATRLSAYDHNYDIEYIFETRNEAGDLQYWEYQNKD